MLALWERLKKRKVVEWGAAYLAGGWLVFEVVGQLSDTFGWGENVGRIAFVVIVVGFLPAVVLAWYHGERGRQRVSGVEALMLAGICVIAATGIVLVRSEPDSVKPDSEAVGLDAATSSIAVLPFSNFGPAEDQHFSDGISEEILNVLAQIPDLLVAARTSSFTYREGSTEIPDIAKALGVAYVLEGSVRRSESHVRITAELIEGPTGFQVWSDTYDRELTPSNIFQIQDDIARRVARELQLRVSGTSVGAARYQTEDAQAHELYLRGRAAFAEGGGDGLRRALNLFQRAAARDEGYALAYAGIAWTYGVLADAYMPPSEAYPSGLEAANHALELAPDLAEALSARGLIRLSYPPWEMEAGYTDAVKALAINPSSPWAYFNTALYSWWRGDPEGCSDLQDAHRVDPLDPLWPHILGFCNALTGRHREAVAAQEIQNEIDPDFTYLEPWVGLSYAALGRDDEAIDRFTRGERFTGRPSVAYAVYLADQGRVEEAREKLRALERTVAAGPHFPPELLAVGWAVLGEDERAFELFEEGLRIGSAAAPILPSIVRVRHLTQTERYRDLADRYGLPLPRRSP